MNIKMNEKFIKHLGLWYVEKAQEVESYALQDYLFAKYLKYSDLSKMEG